MIQKFTCMALNSRATSERNLQRVAWRQLNVFLIDFPSVNNKTVQGALVRDCQNRNPKNTRDCCPNSRRLWGLDPSSIQPAPFPYV
jgi:hypothetical protein